MDDCKHTDTYRIGEIGGRYGDEWCRECGSMRSWDNYCGGREAAVWIKPKGQPEVKKELQKVFVLERCYDYEGCQVKGIYAQQSAANEIADKFNEENGYPKRTPAGPMQVAEWPVTE